MIRSNGVKLLSSHLLNNACKSIYGVFQRTQDSGIWNISRVIGGERRVRHVNLHNRMLSNTSIRASASMSLGNPDSYDMSMTNPNNFSFEDYCKGFEKWCKDHGRTFSSEEEMRNKFQWFLDVYRFNYPNPVLYTGICTEPLARDELEIFNLIRDYRLSNDPFAEAEVLVKKLRQLPAYIVFNMKEKHFKQFVLAHFRKP